MSLIDTLLLYEPDDAVYQRYSAIFGFLGFACQRAPVIQFTEPDSQRCHCLVMACAHLTLSSANAIKHFLGRNIGSVAILLGDETSSVPLNHDGRIFYSPLPLQHQSLMQTIQQAQRLLHHDWSPTPYGDSCGEHRLVGNSHAITHVRQLISQVSPTDANVLILGESGTGKEITARCIHQLSRRSNAPFVAINCGAIPADLLESELFGHERGAFTGAIASRKGRFELAEGGTLFLDEIGDMPIAMQVKLLRVLQEKRFERIGSNQSIEANVRVIAATHRQLEAAIEVGHFREDLYYRLNVFPIDIPPLRERLEDVPLLIEEARHRLKQDNKPTIQLCSDAVRVLCDYAWPGNIRELANIVERLSILYPEAEVNAFDLPKRFRQGLTTAKLEAPDAQLEKILPSKVVATGGSSSLDLKAFLAKTEISIISQALNEADWVVARAASALNMRRTTLVEKIRKFGLARPSPNKDEIY